MSFETETPPKVFISYSHDSTEHKSRVRRLSDRLRQEGVNCYIDQYEESPCEGWPRWMVRQIEEASFVLVVCTETYERRFRGVEESGRGLGGSWEGAILTQHLYNNQAKNTHFIPMVFSTEDESYIPTVLQGSTHYRVDTETGYVRLYRRLTDQPEIRRPELGKRRVLLPLDGQNGEEPALSIPAFADRVVEWLKTNDEVSLRQQLLDSADTFYEAVDQVAGAQDKASITRISDTQLCPVLDNLAVLALVCAKHRRPQFVEEACDALYDIYERAHTAYFGGSPSYTEVNQSWVWEEVIKRVYTVGAALLRLRFYELVPLFIRQPIRWEHSYWQQRFWAKHALTMRSRDGRFTKRGLCDLTEAFVKRHRCFYRQYSEDEDQLRAALCQFDFLQCVHAVHYAGELKAAFPSFGAYNNHRTEPIVSRVLRESQLRAALLPVVTNEELAKIIKGLDNSAGRRFISINGWEGNYWQDQNTRDLLSRY